MPLSPAYTRLDDRLAVGLCPGARHPAAYLLAKEPNHAPPCPRTSPGSRRLRIALLRGCVWRWALLTISLAYNLQPESAEVNLLRSNDSITMIPGEARAFGRCALEIVDRTIEPRPDIRGDIARTYFYMNGAYPGRGIISRQNEQLFEAWDNEDPVDDWERERAKRIEQMQGNRNPFVK